MVTRAFPYTIDVQRKLVRIQLAGSVHGTQIASTFEAVYRDPAFGTGFDLLWDARTVMELLFERDDLPSFVRLQEQYGDLASTGRDIILVTRPLDRTMAQTYAVMMKKQAREVHVCSTPEEADAIVSQRPMRS